MLTAFDRDYFYALLLLMPGFLSHQIMAYFSNAPKGGEFETISTSLAFSLVNFIVGTFLWEGYQKLKGRGIKKTNSSQEEKLRHISSAFVALLLIVSVIVGLMAAYIDRDGIVYKAFSPTPRISRTRPWITMWDKCRPTWTKITLSDGRVYFGYVAYYSDTDESTELVLNRIELEDKSGKRIKLKSQRLLIFGKDITTVEVFPTVGSHCRDENEF